MHSDKYIAYRQKWIANRRQAKLAASPINKVITVEPPEDITPKLVSRRAQLTRSEYEAVYEAALEGMKHLANSETSHSMLFKNLRSAWSKLAPVHGHPKFTIEVK